MKSGQIASDLPQNPQIRKDFSLVRTRSGPIHRKKPAKSLSISMISSAISHKSTPIPAKITAKTRLPALHLPSFPLPRTNPPLFHRQFTIKKRFLDMSKTLESIPNPDWLGTLLRLKPEFRSALERNLTKCRCRLAETAVVRESIREEEDASEQSFLQETAYF
jgi:hypothetical protein